MPHGGQSRRGGEFVHCRCLTCDYELELEEGQRCEAVRCPRCGRPLRPAIEIAQQKGPGGPGRRRDEGEAQIWWIPWWDNGKPPLPGTKLCRCPSCQYTIVVESGTRCLLMDCPLCGHKMTEV